MFLACTAGWAWMAISEHYLGLANRIELTRYAIRRGLVEA